MTSDPVARKFEELHKAGSLAALENFRAELLKDRGRIENEDEPVFDVIIALLDKVIAALSGASSRRS